MNGFLLYLRRRWQEWAARFLIAGVLFWNLQAAVYFMFRPADFLEPFQLEGIPGRSAIIGYGILFLMWCVPYVFALVHPVKWRISLWEALIMQGIGTTAELILLSSIPTDYVLLRSSITRFALFDGAGVLLLMTALVLSRQREELFGETHQK